MSVGQLISIAAVVLFAACIQSLSGFGFALMAVPLLTLAISPRDAVVISTCLGLVTSSVQSWHGRHDVDVPLSRRLIISSIVGMPCGLILLLVASSQVLRAILGVIVIFAAVALFRGVTITQTPRIDWLVGGLSGALSTSLSTNGPPLVFLMQSRHLAPNVFRSTINRVFVVGNVVTLVLFVTAGLITFDRLQGAAVALPSTAIGLVIGGWLRRFVHGDRFRVLVLGLLILSGVSALFAAAR